VRYHLRYRPPSRPGRTVSISFPASTKWGYSFDINEAPGRNGRRAGSESWAGLINCYLWLDPAKKVTGALFTQILPFFDDRVRSTNVDQIDEGAGHVRLRCLIDLDEELRLFECRHQL